MRELQRLDWDARPGRRRRRPRCRADAFCHSMVRSLVGALLDVGRGRRGVEFPAELLRAGRAGVGGGGGARARADAGRRGLPARRRAGRPRRRHPAGAACFRRVSEPDIPLYRCTPRGESGGVSTETDAGRLRRQDRRRRTGWQRTGGRRRPPRQAAPAVLDVDLAQHGVRHDLRRRAGGGGVRPDVRPGRRRDRARQRAGGRGARPAVGARAVGRGAADGAGPPRVRLPRQHPAVRADDDHVRVRVVRGQQRQRLVRARAR